MDMKEKLVELLAEHCAFKEKKCAGCDKEGKYYDPTCKTNLFGKIADHLIANGVAVQEWISVKDRLPEKGKAVLCFCTNDDYWIALWDRCDDQLWSDGEWWRAKDFVTHWMPLPPAPKGE